MESINYTKMLKDNYYILGEYIPFFENEASRRALQYLYATKKITGQQYKSFWGQIKKRQTKDFEAFYDNNFLYETPRKIIYSNNPNLLIDSFVSSMEYVSDYEFVQNGINYYMERLINDFIGIKELKNRLENSLQHIKFYSQPENAYDFRKYLSRIDLTKIG